MTDVELQAVIFEVDGVLVDTREYHYRSWLQVAAILGINLTREAHAALSGLSRADALRRILVGRSVSEDRFYDLLEKKNELFIDQIKETGPQDLMPGAAELLQELRSAAIRLGVSSSSTNAHLLLEKVGLGEYIAAIGDRYKVTRLKPEPGIYFYTASALGVLPGACVAVERGQAGIQAARAAGICVLAVGTGSAAVGLEQKPDAAFSSLADLNPAVLRNLHARFQQAKDRIFPDLNSRHPAANKVDVLNE